MNVLSQRKVCDVRSKLTQELFEQLVQFCKDKDETVSSVVRKAIKEYINKESK